MTEDAANRQKAENSGIASISGYLLHYFAYQGFILIVRAVRKYVEGMKDSNQLLDLLSASGSDEIEPTRAVAARSSLYPDVCPPSVCVRHAYLFT